MAFYDVYSHPALIRHRTRVCTRATLFVCVVLCLTYISPLLVAYRSQGKLRFIPSSSFPQITWWHEATALWTGFWLKSSTYEEQAVVQFQYDMIVIGATDTAGTYIAWSTFPNFNRLMGDHLRIPSVSVRTTCCNIYLLSHASVRKWPRTTIPGIRVHCWISDAWFVLIGQYLRVLKI